MFDTGHTAFMLIATSLVMLMTPGLALFYGGLVGRKNVGGIMLQSFVSLGVTTILWYAVGYSLCFSGDVGGIIGNLDMAFLRGVRPLDAFDGPGSIPLLVFVAYQMMFAVITPALITGAFANRVRFSAYLIFLVAWLLLVYFPLAHMVWGGGLLQQWGVLDFAGGIVVHASAGFAALAAVMFVGPRKVKDEGPHSIPLVAIGTALLWFGWYGFNAGSELQVDEITVVAFVNTDISASFAAMVWLALSWLVGRKPTFVGFMTGVIAGLATITPAAGFVSTHSAALIGIVAGGVCYYAVEFIKRSKLDDALDVWAVHGVGGFVGILLLGLLADPQINPGAGATGLLFGDGAFFLKQLVAVVGASVYAFLFTWVMLFLIQFVTRVGVTAKEEEEGIDSVFHGEAAYGDARPL